jgi:hypothetical protein
MSSPYACPESPVAIRIVDDGYFMHGVSRTGGARGTPAVLALDVARRIRLGTDVNRVRVCDRDQQKCRHGKRNRNEKTTYAGSPSEDWQTFPALPRDVYWLLIISRGLFTSL